MHTVQEWKARLRPSYREALDEREVVDTIVSYEGGLASGYEVVCLVNEVWGIQLPAKAMWKE